jgi:TonB family protein
MTRWQKLVAATTFVMVAALPSTLLARHRFDPLPEDGARVTLMKSGTLSTKDGLRLQFRADLGNVHIFTDASRTISYRVIVEADSRDPDAEKILRGFSLIARQNHGGISLNGRAPSRTFLGRLRVNFEIHIPRRYSLDVTTQAGNIDVRDVDGQVALITAGGNIDAGRVGAVDGRMHPIRGGLQLEPAPGVARRIVVRLETQGGHISIGDVAGDLHATTAGGHISAGNIEGDAVLHTGGGHIETGRVTGMATLDTGGGNIHITGAGSNVTAITGGGLIDLGDVAGAIHTHTGGGAVRIERVSGPAAVDASGGNVFLRQVDGPLHVSAATGNITAWINDGFEPSPTTTSRGVRKMRGTSELTSAEGDIIVYLPRALALTIDALIEEGSGHSIVADSSLAMTCQDSPSGIRAHHCEGNVNGGGEVLHLKSTSGNIVLKVGEPDATRNAGMSAPWMQIITGPPPAQAWSPREGDVISEEGFIQEVRRRIQESWWGVVPIDASELQKHLEQSVAPVYPEVARKAGVEGDIILRAYVSGDGRVAGLKVLEGPPILARAAIEAVQQWRYQPVTINGRPTNVVTTFVVAFRLH